MKELSIAIVVAALVIGLFGRYTVSGSGANLSSAFVVDGLTGQSWFCGPRGCKKLD